MAAVPPPPSTDVPQPPIHFTIGQARIPGSNTPQDAIITFFPAINGVRQTATNETAEVLIQKRMVEIGYVHTGWSSDRDLIRYQWNQWLAPSALYHPATDPSIRDSCLNLIQSRVKHFSTKWRKLGLWTVQGKHFCTVCRGLEGRDKDREESTVIYSPWILHQTQCDEWNGVFTEIIPTILCPEHLSLSITQSPWYYSYSVEQLRALITQLDGQLRYVLGAPQGYMA